MKKTKRLWFFGLVIVLVGILALVSINFLEAKKPPKETFQWNARIPAESLNLKGMLEGEYVYEDIDNSIRVSVSRSERGGDVKYYIKFFIYQNDGSIWARFQDIFFDDWEVTGDGEGCGFPYPHNTLLAPDCVASLMEDQQPLPGYEHLMVMFDIHADIEDESLFPLGIRTSYTGSGNIKFYIWNSFECDNPDKTEPWYHTVSGWVSHLDRVDPAGFFITRVDGNTWQIEVSMQDFGITESYCYEEWGEPKGKKGRREYTRYNYTPFEATANLSYILELKRHSQ
jgi:hypothetical protein